MILRTHHDGHRQLVRISPNSRKLLTDDKQLEDSARVPQKAKAEA